jgi:hypothetical protein
VEEMGNKREGYVVVVLVLIFMVLPAIIMVASATTGNFKSIIINKDYHQKKLNEMSMKEVGLKGAEEAIRSIDLLVKQDVFIVEGIEVKGNYYLEDAANIDIMKTQELIKAKGGFKDKLGISVLLVEDMKVESNYESGKMELPYAVEQAIGFTLHAEGLFGIMEQKLVMSAAYILDVGDDGLLVVRDVSVTD